MQDLVFFPPKSPCMLNIVKHVIFLNMYTCNQKEDKFQKIVPTCGSILGIDKIKKIVSICGFDQRHFFSSRLKSVFERLPRVTLLTQSFFILSFKLYFFIVRE